MFINEIIKDQNLKKWLKIIRKNKNTQQWK